MDPVVERSLEEGLATRIDLNDLPSYSEWLGKFLANCSLPVLPKDTPNLLREFGQDKWGALAERLGVLDRPDIADADRLFLGDAEIVFCYREQLFRCNAQEAHNLFVQLVLGTLKSYTCDHIVELGAGYGSIVLKIASQREHHPCGFTACDLTEQGISCIKALSRHMKIRLDAGICDLRNLDLSEFRIPENAVFLTAWAMGYVQGFPEGTLREIIRHRPSVVLHFEPIYDHWGGKTLLGALRRKYCEVNDYNRTLLRDLKRYEQMGLIEIEKEDRNLFGENVLAPVSLIAWRPARGA